MENLLEYSARRNELDWAIRNKAKLTPEQRAKYRAMWEEMNSSTPPSSSTAEVSFGPADLDPVEAAATPIAPDPVAGPVRNRSRADAAVDRSMSGSMYSPSEIVDSMDVTDMPTRVELDNAMVQQSDGLPPGYAAWSAGMAEASGDKPRAERLRDADAFDARADRMTAGYNAATGMPQPSGLTGSDGSRDWSGWQPGDALPERPRMGPTALESARESQAADRNAAIGQKYGPIAQRIAEAGDAAGVTDYAAVQSPQERQMNTYRRAIEQEARFGADKESRKKARETLATLDKSRAKDNIAFREKVANAPGAQARRDKEQSSLERWQAISMLAGGNPSRQQFAMGNAFLNMPSDWQNAVSAKALRPDMDGTTPLTVDANSAKNAMRLLNAEMIGQGGLGDTRAKMMAAQERDKAFAFAEREAKKMGLMGYWNPSMTRQEAERLRRRVEAMHPGMGSVVDALPITEEGESPAAGPSIPAPPPGASGAPVPPMPSGRPGPPRPGRGSRYPNT
jgi:hypothetical protein